MSKDKDTKKAINRVFIAGIVITIIFIILLVTYSIKIKNEDSCGAERYGYKNNAELQNSTLILSKTGDYLLQEITINKTYPIDYNFCFYGLSNGSGLLRIINEDNDTLGKAYYNNYASKYCSPINIDNLKRKILIGVYCEDCMNPINIQSQLLGQDVTVTFYSDSILNVTQHDVLSYSIYGSKSCINMVKLFFNIYAITMMVLMVIIGIIYGYEFLEEEIINKVVK